MKVATAANPRLTAMKAAAYAVVAVPHGQPGLQSREERSMAADHKSSGFFVSVCFPVRFFNGRPDRSSRKAGRRRSGTATSVRSPALLEQGWRFHAAIKSTNMNHPTAFTPEIRQQDGLRLLNRQYNPEICPDIQRSQKPHGFMRVGASGLPTEPARCYPDHGSDHAILLTLTKWSERLS